jgi:hypothetical protein
VVATFLDAFHEVGASEHSDEAAVALFWRSGFQPDGFGPSDAGGGPENPQTRRLNFKDRNNE